MLRTCGSVDICFVRSGQRPELQRPHAAITVGHHHLLGVYGLFFLLWVISQLILEQQLRTSRYLRRVKRDCNCRDACTPAGLHRTRGQQTSCQRPRQMLCSALRSYRSLYSRRSGQPMGSGHTRLVHDKQCDWYLERSQSASWPFANWRTASSECKQSCHPSAP